MMLKRMLLQIGIVLGIILTGLGISITNDCFIYQFIHKCDPHHIIVGDILLLFGWTLFVISMYLYKVKQCT